MELEPTSPCRRQGTPENCRGSPDRRGSSAISWSPSPTKVLLSGIVDGAVDGGKEIWRSDVDAPRQAGSPREARRRKARTLPAKPVGRGSARRHSSNCACSAKSRSRRASPARARPARERRSCRCRRASAPSARIGHGAACARRNLQPHEDGIIRLVDVVHDAGDGEPRRHRIAKRPNRNSPAGSCHFTSIGRPASPGFSQYPCQPGLVRMWMASSTSPPGGAGPSATSSGSMPRACAIAGASSSAINSRIRRSMAQWGTVEWRAVQDGRNRAKFSASSAREPVGESFGCALPGQSGSFWSASRTRSS